MAKGLFNRQVLNRIKPLELNLELFSFAGGENTIGADHELKSNEARVIKNWLATSLGGMRRAPGFNLIASGANTIEAAVFTGAGLDDATAGGTYTGTVTATYTIIIDGTGTPDTFKWKKNDGAFTETVAITGAAQTLSDGVTVTFGATTGHTSADQWVITAVSYSSKPNLLIQHFEGVNTELYGVIEDDLVILSSGNLNQEDANKFTSGTLCRAISAGAGLWITNVDDGLQKKTIGNALADPSDTPGADDYARISAHKNRLIVEGSKTVPRKVEGSRLLPTNWDASDAWSKATDAWNILLPDDTKGHMVDWPSGDEISVWTKFSVYALSGFPNVGFRPIGSQAYGCSAPDSIAKGPEGVFFYSEYPNKGIILWDGVNFIDLTENHDFIDNVNLSQRVFGVYRNQEYHFFYTDSDTGDAFPNRWRIYDTRHGRWWEREINADLSDTFGYPALLTRSANELYVASAQTDKIYELETTDNDDEGFDTEADYKTKDFTSRDFNVGSGGLFGIDNVRLKLIGFFLTYNGNAGSVSVQWTADKGRKSGARVVNIGTEGEDRLNIDFTLNSSSLVGSPTDKTVFKTFGNNATGETFNFQILNSGQGFRPEIKKLKIMAIALGE